MHPTALLAIHRGRSAGPTRASFCTAAWTRQHGAGLTRVIARHFFPLNGAVPGGVCDSANEEGGDAALCSLTAGPTVATIA